MYRDFLSKGVQKEILKYPVCLEKVDDGFQITKKIFLECTIQNKCDGNHNRVEGDNLKMKLCLQIVAFHLLIQSLIKENSKDNLDFFDELKKNLLEKSKEFELFCALMKICCKNSFRLQIQDFNNILHLHYNEIIMRFSKSLDSRAKNLNENLMHHKVNQFLIDSNKFHYQRNIQSSKKKNEEAEKEKISSTKNYGKQRESLQDFLASAKTRVLKKQNEGDENDNLAFNFFTRFALIVFILIILIFFF